MIGTWAASWRSSSLTLHGGRVGRRAYNAASTAAVPFLKSCGKSLLTACQLQADRPARPPARPPPGSGLRPRRDLPTSTQLTSFKGNACGPNALARLGRDYLIAAQLGARGGALHAWAWHKDTVHLKSFAAEPLGCVAASPDGTYCAAGGASGAIYLWETSSGRLLRSWPAHYKVGERVVQGQGPAPGRGAAQRGHAPGRSPALTNPCSSTLASTPRPAGAAAAHNLLQAPLQAALQALPQAVTVLAFNDAGSVLVSGGEDTLVNAWLLAEVLDCGGGLGALGGPPPLAPLHSWSDHTLPITALAVGAGAADPVLASASLDRTVKLRSLVGGGLLAEAAFPTPIHR